MVKISLVGDIMCEPLLLKAARRGNTYDFSGVFRNVKELFTESDYVIGNLETPLAGEKAGYVHELFSFNAPDEFAEAIKQAGINFVSTANNHCMDRGVEGIKRTVKILDDIGLAHSGTYDETEHPHVPFVVTMGDTRIAIVSFTYGTNYGMHHRALPDRRFVNLLHSDTEPTYISAKKSGASQLKNFLLKPLKKEQIAFIKKTLGMEYNKARKDDYLNTETAEPYFAELQRQIELAGQQADIVIFYPHVGGQFNKEPGRFTEYTIERAIDFGADVIIASHPHVIQKMSIVNEIPVFYSAGNFSMSPNSIYLLHEDLPEYGLVVHLYISEKRIIKKTFSILRITEEKGHMLTVWPVDKIAEPNEKEIRQIYRMVTGRELAGNVIRHEYEC